MFAVVIVTLFWRDIKVKIYNYQLDGIMIGIILLGIKKHYFIIKNGAVL
jgi:hypothetical protein